MYFTVWVLDTLNEYLKANLDGWVTPLLAVDPPYQQRGIGAAMFNEMTSQVARHTSTTCLS